jgi:hypothetical protein
MALALLACEAQLYFHMDASCAAGWSLRQAPWSWARRMRAAGGWCPASRLLGPKAQRQAARHVRPAVATVLQVLLPVNCSTCSTGIAMCR